MSKVSSVFESEVKNCWAFGKFAVELLERVSQDHQMNFETLWTQYFPNLPHVKALKNARNFIKQCDPRNMVSPAKSDYHYYLTEQSQAIQASGSQYDITKHGKEIGRRWKELTPEQRQQYQTLACADRERRQRELEEIEGRIRAGTLQDSPFRRGVRHRTGNVSALNMYVREMTRTLRDTEPTLSNTERMTRIHQQWKLLTPEQLAVYQSLAETANRANAEANAETSADATTVVVVVAPTEASTPAPVKKAKGGKKASAVQPAETPAPVSAPTPAETPAPVEAQPKKSKGGKKASAVQPTETPAPAPVEVPTPTPTPAPVEPVQETPKKVKATKPKSK